MVVKNPSLRVATDTFWVIENIPLVVTDASQMVDVCNLDLGISSSILEITPV